MTFPALRVLCTYTNSSSGRTRGRTFSHSPFHYQTLSYGRRIPDAAAARDDIFVYLFRGTSWNTQEACLLDCSGGTPGDMLNRAAWHLGTTGFTRLAHGRIISSGIFRTQIGLRALYCSNSFAAIAWLPLARTGTLQNSCFARPELGCAAPAALSGLTPLFTFQLPFRDWCPASELQDKKLQHIGG